MAAPHAHCQARAAVVERIMLPRYGFVKWIFRAGWSEPRAQGYGGWLHQIHQRGCSAFEVDRRGGGRRSYLLPTVWGRWGAVAGHAGIWGQNQAALYQVVNL